MKTQERAEQHMKSLKMAIDDMEPIRRMCAVSLIHMSTGIINLINQSDWGAIAEMRQVCTEIFDQAEEVRQRTSEIIQ